MSGNDAYLLEHLEEGVDPGLDDEIEHQCQQEDEHGVRRVLIERGSLQIPGELLQVPCGTPSRNRLCQITWCHQVPTPFCHSIEHCRFM